jgi:hypothetical protein
MWMKTFFKSLTSISTRRRPTRRSPPSSRPTLEALEDRCLLSFSPLVDYYGTGSTPGALAAVDLNGDGNLDLASVSSYGATGVSVLLGNGDATFQAARHSGIGSNSEPLVADLNGDAIDDLVTVDPSYRLDLRVQLGNGDGTYQQTQVIVLPSQLPAGAAAYYPVQKPISAALGDLNGDGKLDLVAAGFDEEVIDPEGTVRQDHYVNVLLGNGDGTFGQSTAYYITSTTYNESSSRTHAFVLGMRDFDGDGKSDVLMTGDAMRLFAGNGDGTLQTPPHFFPGSWAPDVNADGKLDSVNLDYNVVFYSDFGADTIRYAQVQLGDGDGSFASPVISDLGTVRAESTAGSPMLADFDGDGFPELVVSEFRIQESGYAYGVVGVAHNDGIWALPPPPPPPSITISDVTLTEGNIGTRAANFTVSLSAASGQSVSVAYATADGTATAGSDYQAASGTLTIPAGQTTGTITVLVKGDRLAEADEAFFVNLSSATNATIADGQGTGTTVDDEPRINIGDVTTKEGKKGQTTLFTFTITLSAAYDQTVTMSFGTANGTAKTSDNDYVAKTGTLTFAPGETTKTITIGVKGDSKKEAKETFYLDLFDNSSNSLFTKKRGLGTILNDD